MTTADRTAANWRRNYLEMSLDDALREAARDALEGSVIDNAKTGPDGEVDNVTLNQLLQPADVVAEAIASLLGVDQDPTRVEWGSLARTAGEPARWEVVPRDNAEYQVRLQRRLGIEYTGWTEVKAGQRNVWETDGGCTVIGPWAEVEVTP